MGSIGYIVNLLIPGAFTKLIKFLGFCEPNRLESRETTTRNGKGNPGSDNIDHYAEWSGKNNVTIAFIDFPSVCHRKYHKLNINTMLLMILQNLYFNIH